VTRGHVETCQVWTFFDSAPVQARSLPGILSWSFGPERPAAYHGWVPAERHRFEVDVNGLKGRIAEAFVEAIFRRAGYTVSRVGRESQVHRLVKIGSDEFLPDFLVRKQVRRDDTGRPLHRLLPVEVKYRRNVDAFLRRYGKEFFGRLSEQWPDLCVVFVTDEPSAGRSCFQIVEFGARRPVGLQNLHAIPDLDIYETTVREYESLVREIFPLVERVGAAASEVPKAVRG
jgi:hypothetical protein